MKAKNSFSWKGKIHGFLFSSSILILALSILTWNPAHSDFVKNRNMRLNSIVKVYTESQLIMPSLLIYSRGELDKQIYRIAEEGLNPQKELKLSLTDWMAKKTEILEDKGIIAEFRPRIYIRCLQSPRSPTLQDKIILCESPRYGCVYFKGPLFYKLQETSTDTAKEGSLFIDAVHPVRIYLLHQTCENIIESLNFTLNHASISLPLHHAAEAIESNMKANIEQKISPYLEEERDLEVNVRYTLTLSSGCHEYFSTTVKGKYTTFVYVFWVELEAKIDVTDMKQDAKVLVGGKIRKVTFKKDFFRKIYAGSKTLTFEGDLRGRCRGMKIHRSGQINLIS